MKIADYNDSIIVLKFFGNDFDKGLEEVKQLTGPYYVAAGKFWTAPYTETNIKKLKEFNWVFTEKLNAVINTDSVKEVSVDENELKGMFPFQIEAVKWLESRNGTGLISDEMGMGKTVEAIGYANIHKDKRPVLVICPASVKMNWGNEIEEWTKCKDYTILYGTEPSEISYSDWIIINYDILSYWLPVLKEMKIKIMILDESQYIANNTTIRTKSVKELRKAYKDIPLICLSGTPIRNRPSEFFTTLNLMAPKVFPSRYKYLHEFCNPVFNGFGWVYNGASHVDELHTLIKPYMLRRTKKEVALELPDKIKTIVPLELENVEMKNYTDAEKEFAEWLNNHYTTLMKEKELLEHLRQLAYLAKRKAMLQWISDFISTDEKLVVMAYHTMAIDDIYSKFKNVAVKLDGRTNQLERQTAIDTFQKDIDKKLFIGQINAAGVGITLTAAHSLAFVEFTYTPTDHLQAEDRIHRIGQDAEMVNIYYLVGFNTVEERITKIIDRKNNIVSEVVDGKENKVFFGEEDILKELTKQYKNRKY